MPFGAYCKKCKHHLIGEKLLDIRREMTRHFKNRHRRSPNPEIRHVIFNRDFKPNKVRLLGTGPHGYSQIYTFLSRLYCSDDYCIAVIIWYDYRILEKVVQDKKTSSRQKQQSLRPTLQPYF